MEKKIDLNELMSACEEYMQYEQIGIDEFARDCDLSPTTIKKFFKNPGGAHRKTLLKILEVVNYFTDEDRLEYIDMFKDIVCKEFCGAKFFVGDCKRKCNIHNLTLETINKMQIKDFIS